MKRLLVTIVVFAILAFIFADSLFFLAGRWQEKTGKIKNAVGTYSRLIKKYPRSKWVAKAREALERLEKPLGKKDKKEKAGSVKLPENPYYKNILEKTEKKVKEIEKKTNEEINQLLEEK